MKLPIPQRKPSFGKSMLTPMIDIVFLLLVFFICASSGRVVEQVLPRSFASGVSQASSTPAPTLPAEEFWIEIRLESTSEPNVELNGQPCDSLQQLSTRLAEIKASQQSSADAADPVIILKPAPDVATQTIVDILDVCQQAGLDNVNFAAPEKPAGQKQ